MMKKIPKTTVPHKHFSKAGLPPGSILYTGQYKEVPVRITSCDYAKDSCQTSIVYSVADIPDPLPPGVNWITLSGLHDTSVIESIGTRFNLHPLLLEDVVHTTQRSKCDEYENCVFIVLKLLESDIATGSLGISQVSIVVTNNMVLLFLEHDTPVFDAVRQRIELARGRVRLLGADYLAYSLVDAVVDSYFGLLEGMSDYTEDLEPLLITSPGPEILQRLYQLKKLLIATRKTIWPLRETIAMLERTDSPFISKATKLYIRDVYDHTIQIIDSVESLRDLASGLFDIYLSSASNRMNEIMKVLTIIATIFIPVTFIAGVYGMNFKVMPELSWRYGYFGVWAIMIAVMITMVLYFKRKSWL